MAGIGACVLIDDGQAQMGPLTDCQALFDLRLGVLTNWQRLGLTLGMPINQFWVPGDLLGLTIDQHSDASCLAIEDEQAIEKWCQQLSHSAESVLLMNAAWTGALLADETNTSWLNAFIDGLNQPNSSTVWLTQDGLQNSQPIWIAARLQPNQVSAFLSNWSAYLNQQTSVQQIQASGAQCVQRPWQALNHLADRVQHDVHLLKQAGLLTRLTHTSAETNTEPEIARSISILESDADHGVWIAPHLNNGPQALDPQLIQAANQTHIVQIDPGTVLDARKGPIVLSAGSTIGSMTVIEGACAVLDRATVHPQSLIRPGSVIGPVCKVAGEISASIFMGYSNKGHLGFVGDAIIAPWCNLGANTNVSNLKNTYGPVRVTLDQGLEPEETGRVFHGPVMGSFVRTAIGTHLMTGSVIATGSMLAVSQYPPKYVDRCRFVTDQGDQSHGLSQFIQVVEAMMSRRGLAPSAALIQRLKQLHAQSIATWV